MMEKLLQMKDKLFKLILKQPVASMAFQNPTMIPSGSVTPRGGRSSAHRVSIVPKEARIKPISESLSVQEPNSPKVSCLGQVKGKNRKAQAHKQKRVQTLVKNDSATCPEKKKFLLWVSKRKGVGPEEIGKLEEKPPNTHAAPSLGTMKECESSRGSLSGFYFTLLQR
ncbi:hypothetical protein VNO78_34429 [Psophocarpus tetragonolobus]|uniref:Uncharacterized protein n=1 Tax=Psophocarpus tetragonolobus TaxID=3891 RepID=A0AAN9NUT1_PSOTE